MFTLEPNIQVGWEWRDGKRYSNQVVTRPMVANPNIRQNRIQIKNVMRYK